jgi:hypothetical protein
LGLALIGIGSFGFHASLQWEWQLLDELPMVRHTLANCFLTLRSTLRPGLGSSCWTRHPAGSSVAAGSDPCW